MYTTTRRNAIDYLTRRLEELDLLRNSPDEISRALARDAYQVVAEVLQWIDSGPDVHPAPMTKIAACLGDVRILDEEDEYIQIYPLI